MWDVKARVSAADGNSSEAQTRSSSSRAYLTAMRRAMFVAVLAFVFGLGDLLFFAWVASYPS